MHQSKGKIRDAIENMLGVLRPENTRSILNSILKIEKNLILGVLVEVSYAIALIAVAIAIAILLTLVRGL
jgi:hypothetical protein